MLTTNAPASQGKLSTFATGVHATEKSFYPAWPKEIWANSHPPHLPSYFPPPRTH